jgi:hypothetical protein
MFAFFLENNFLDFWANKPGDIFTDITIDKMKWQKEKVSLYFYADIPINRPEYFYFDQDKNLVFQNKIITTQEVDGEQVSVEQMVDVSTVPAIPYIISGEKVLPC